MRWNSTADWQIRCPKCGCITPYAATGGIRAGAYSRGKRIGGWCRTCRWFRMLIVERVPETATAKPAAWDSGERD